MAVHFDRSRMEEALHNHEKWWRGELDRPLRCVKIVDAYDPIECKYPVLSQANCHDLSVPAEQIIKAWDAQLSRYEFLGDAYPVVGLAEFGPGIVAAFCGARLDNSSGGVWFFPQEKKEISETHAYYDPNNKWAKRIKEIIRTGIEYWDGKVAMGLPDFGGILDIAASLVGTEELLFALIEEPEEVQRLCTEIQQAWYESFNDICAVMAPQGFYTDWNYLLSKTPTHVLQCDFSIMISPDMFKEFVLNYLKEDTRRLEHCIYHLDGPGALQHLDDLLSIKDLTAIQWVYGDGQPGPTHWIDVYKKIAEAGKGYMILGGTEDYLEVLDKVHGNPYSWHYFVKSHTNLIDTVLKAK